jgi:hypothetical protein
MRSTVLCVQGAGRTSAREQKKIRDDDTILIIELSAPAIVSAEDWEVAQKRPEENRTSMKGKPARIQMLTGRTYCPHCGERAIVKYQNANGKKYRYFTCARRRKAAVPTGDTPCSGDLYPIDSVEDATLKVVQQAWLKPEAIAAAEVVHIGETEPMSTDAVETRREFAALNKALDQLKKEEATAVQGQIAGIRAGASPDAYREIFADIAARRKDLENRRGELSRCVASVAVDSDGRSDEALTQQALADALNVLTSEETAGSLKHGAVMQIVDRIV